MSLLAHSGLFLFLHISRHVSWFIHKWQMTIYMKYGFFSKLALKSKELSWRRAAMTPIIEQCDHAIVKALVALPAVVAGASGAERWNGFRISKSTLHDEWRINARGCSRLCHRLWHWCKLIVDKHGLHQSHTNLTWKYFLPHHLPESWQQFLTLECYQLRDLNKAL